MLQIYVIFIVIYETVILFAFLNKENITIFLLSKVKLTNFVRL